MGSSLAGGLFLFPPTGLSLVNIHIESLTCIKGEDTHIADFPFQGKAVSVPLSFCALFQALKITDRTAGRSYPSALSHQAERKTLCITLTPMILQYV